MSRQRSAAGSTNRPLGAGVDGGAGECADAPGTLGGGTNTSQLDPWKIVREEISKLKDVVDVTSIKSQLWIASLISYEEYCDLELGTKTKPGLAENLLIRLIMRGNRREFDDFLGILESVPTYRERAKELKTKVNEQIGEGGGAGRGISDGGADTAQQNPWNVVQVELSMLKDALDITLIKSQLSSADLITYQEYCDLGLSIKSKPDHTEEILVKLIKRGGKREFYRFLSILESVATYRRIAKHLKTKAKELGGDISSVSEVCPFVVVQRSHGRVSDLAVDGRTIEKIQEWDRRGLSKKQESDRGGETDGNQPELSSNVWRKSKADYDNPDMWKSANLLSRKVKLHTGCTDKEGAGIVVLTGQVTEIAAWLRGNDIVTEEQELGRMQNSLDDDVGTADGMRRQSLDAITSSGIYCVIPQDGNTLYLVVRLRWMDEPEVQIQLLRIALELSPMWLIFYNRAGIEQNGFCVEAYREPRMPSGHYFEHSSNDAQKTADLLISQLRSALTRFPYGNNFVQPLALLHIEFVFDVSLQFFSSAMVYHNPLLEDSQARCTVMTREKFFVQSDSRTSNPAVVQIQQGIPDLTIGISLRRELKPSSVEAYPVDLRWWLQMSSSYVEIAMLSCSSKCSQPTTEATTVECMLFPPSLTLSGRAREAYHATDVEQCDVCDISAVTDGWQPVVAVDVEASGDMGSSQTDHIDRMRDEILDVTSNGANVHVHSDEGLSAEASMSTQDSMLIYPQQQHAGQADSMAVESNQTSAELSENVRKTMKNLKFPASLTHTFLEWRGPVQTIVCVGADVEKACSLLNELTGSALGLFAKGPMMSPSDKAAAETLQESSRSVPVSYMKSTHAEAMPIGMLMAHRHFPASQIWICCRPSDAVLYVLLCFGQLSLPAAACPRGYHESATLVTAAALANMFIVLAEGFPQEVDVIEDLLLPGLSHFGKHIPRRKDRERQLFNGLLVPVTASADIAHKCRSGPCCTQHFRRICKEKSWWKYRGELHHYFVGVQPTCSKTPERTIANLLTESHLCHRSGTHFHDMLRFILAAMKVQGADTSHSLQHLQIERIMEGQWIEFQKMLRSGLAHGTVKGTRLCKCENVECQVDVRRGQKKSAVFPSTLELGILQESLENGVHYASYSQSQQKSVRLVVKEVTRAVDPQLQEGNYKNVPPADLLAALPGTLRDLVERRRDECRTWYQETIQREPFGTSDGARKVCTDLIDKFDRQWNVCEEQCEGLVPNGDRCRYYCLLPKSHSQDVRHDCLDPTQRHDCEWACDLCQMEGSDAKQCIKAAGHQHYVNYDMKLHICEKKHLCEADCSLAGARGCTAGHKGHSDSRAGKCRWRIDHCTHDGKQIHGHLCSVDRELHLCNKPCALKGTQGCKGGLCNKLYDTKEHDLHLCGEIHTCKRWCAQPGVCRREKCDEPVEQDDKKRMKGKDGWRLRCANQKIKVDAKEHDRPCSCGEMHTCDKLCPFCKCYCKKKYHHNGLCEVDHGEVCADSPIEIVNMRKENLAVDMQRLRCNEICSRGGRGHAHLVICKRKCDGTHGFQHHKETGHDFVRHDMFWKELNLVDPYKPLDIDFFSGCPETCQHPEHSDSKSPEYCSERLYHPPISSSSLQSQFKGSGYISHVRNGVPAGHHFACSKHKCSYSGTICRKKNKGKECGSPCTMDVGHLSDCQCSGKHECGKQCAAKGCQGKCTKSPEPAHSKAQCSCGNEGCTEDCEICDPPKRKCCSPDHLHKPWNEKHHCRNEHPCQDVCTERGICDLASPGKECEQPGCRRVGINGLKLKCEVKRPKGKEYHPNKDHSCGRQHTCEKCCPLCGYYCERPVRHVGKCKTSQHGPAKNLTAVTGGMVISADGKEIRLDPKLTCDKLCDLAGRGHSHILKCNCESKWAANRYLKERFSRLKRRHCGDYYSGEDMAAHSEFWDSLAFSDPAAGEEAAEFDSCGAVCPSCHEKVLCMETIHHEPLQREHFTGMGFVGPKSHPEAYGHHFPCAGHMCENKCLHPGRLYGHCGKPCDGISDHVEKCRCEKHWNTCGKPCDAMKCDESCTISVREPHNVHCCDEKDCQFPCEFEGCTELCGLSHVHDKENKEGKLMHHCKFQHRCRKRCGSKGYCGRQVQGMFSSKDMQLEDGTANGYRDQCAMRIEPGEKAHVGDCLCSTEPYKHACPAVCPLCLCVCKHDIDHHGMHDFNHGKVIANNPGVIHATGELAMERKSCRDLCQKAGRGHSHAISTASFIESSIAVDKNMISEDGKCVLHSYFWSQQYFKDPVPQGEVLDGCPAKCSKKKGEHCTEKRWHADILRSGQGHTSKEKMAAAFGDREVFHHFPCRHLY